MGGSFEAVFSGIGAPSGDTLNIGPSGDQADDLIPLLRFRQRAEANVSHWLPLEARRSAPAKSRLRAKQDRQGVRPLPGPPPRWSWRQRGAEPRVCWPAWPPLGHVIPKNSWGYGFSATDKRLSYQCNLHRFVDVCLAPKNCRAVERLDETAIDFEDACGAIPVRGLLIEAKRRGLSIERLDLRNSGDTAGDRDRVVGYGAWAIRAG